MMFQQLQQQHHNGSKHIFLQGRSTSGLVLSTDAKPRLKWTPALHDKFIEAVNQLGGADKATPKSVMRLMGIPGLTLYHLKSHLQKYRLSKNIRTQANNSTSKIGCDVASSERLVELGGTILCNNGSQAVPHANKGIEITEALQLQIEVQRKLHEQLEVQRHLQLRIEAQGKYLQSVLEKAQESLTVHNLGSTGLEDAKAQLSHLVTQLSHDRVASPATDGLPPPSSADSCLTSSYTERHPVFPFTSGFDGMNGGGGDGEDHYVECKLRHERLLSSCLTMQLDLNVGGGDGPVKFSCEELDLNGLSWN